MRNLLGFLIRISPLLLFILFETVAVVLMVQRSRYHSYSIISTSNSVSGGLLDASDAITSYFSLSSTNEQLSLENSKLKNEIALLKSCLSEYVDSATLNELNDSVWQGAKVITHIPAKVIGNSVNKLENYITIDKGSSDGVTPDMGVVCSQGVVGIVSTVSEHYSVVLPIINSKSRISCRLDSSKVVGSLVWNGLNPSYASLLEVPRHVKVTIGEKIYTSGFSFVFPEGVIAGEVAEAKLEESDSFYKIKIKLSTSFYSLSYVDVISFSGSDELRNIQDGIEK